MRLRSQVGTDVAYEALRRYLRRPGASTGNLLRLAPGGSGAGERCRTPCRYSRVERTADLVEGLPCLAAPGQDRGAGTQELFEFYLLERFLYGISASRYRDRFVLSRAASC